MKQARPVMFLSSLSGVIDCRGLNIRTDQDGMTLLNPPIEYCYTRIAAGLSESKNFILCFIIIDLA